MHYNRQLKVDLLEAMRFFPAIGVLGPRQVGKTTLAKMIQAEINKSVVYLDLENPNDQAKLNDPILYFDSSKADCIIIDEIQIQPALFPVLRSVIDQNRVSGRFIILGSASLDIIQNASEFLSGRIAYFELSPLNLLELKQSNIELGTQHFFRGGFPEAFLAPSEHFSRLWIKNFIKTYVERDLPLLGMPANPILTQRLLSMIATAHGTILNKETLSRSLGVTSTTINNYLNYLKGAFLIRLLQPWFNNTKKRLIKAPKIFIRDTGILHQILNIRNHEELLGHIAIGNSWEGYVIEQIISVLGDHFQYSYYRTQDGSECDLIITHGIVVKMAIEIKFSNAPKLTKGNTLAFDTIAAERNFVITPSSETFKIKENVVVTSLNDFVHETLTNEITTS